MVRSRTKATEFSFIYIYIYIERERERGGGAGGGGGRESEREGERGGERENSFPVLPMATAEFSFGIREFLYYSSILICHLYKGNFT